MYGLEVMCKTKAHTPWSIYRGFTVTEKKTNKKNKIYEFNVI